MLSLKEQVCSCVEKRNLFVARQRILVAVSGGVDSMVLLHVLHDLSRESSWNLTIAHLNHCLRGTSSLADERLVRRTAADLKLPIVAEQADVRAFARSRDLSIEMAGRNLRHDFLARAAAQRKIPSIALAHHLDDQIELFFLRLLRGTGSEGLSGMKWSSPSPANRAVTLVRPLLDCPKSTLREYALQQGIRFREDASNDHLDFIRNRVRQELLPLLERKYQGALRGTILRTMDILGAESAFVNALAESWLNQPPHRFRATANGKGAGRSYDLLLRGEDGEKLPFEELPVAIQRRCVQLQLIDQRIVPTYDLVEHLRFRPGEPIEVSEDKTQNRGNSRTIVLVKPRPGPRVRLVREPGGLVLPSPLRSEAFRRGYVELDLTNGLGQIDWDGVKFAWRVQAFKGLKRQKVVGAELFDADAVGPEVILRHWRPGDRFQPIGMAQPVKLQDLFVNHKVPRERRRTLAVAATARGELFWVEGLRISERFKLTKGTIRRLHWAWQRL